MEVVFLMKTKKSLVTQGSVRIRNFKLAIHGAIYHQHLDTWNDMF